MSPESVGLDPVLLDRLHQDVAVGRLPNVHGIVIARGGKLADVGEHLGEELVVGLVVLEVSA